MKAGFLALCLLTAFAPAFARESYKAAPGLIQPGGLILFFNAQGPLSYAAIARKPVGAVDAGPVTCTSCQHAVSLPFLVFLNNSNSSLSAAAGNGGFNKALAKLKSEHPELKGVYDVKVDAHLTSFVFGIYSRLCTDLTARGFK